MKNYLLVLSFFLISLVTAIFVSTKLYPKEQTPSKIEQKLYDYIIQEYDSNDISYKALSTEISPLYDYTPFEVGECAKDIARMELTMESAYPDTLYQQEDFQNCNTTLYEMLTNVNCADSIRTQIEWLIVHTYYITPYEVYTRTFYTDMNYDKLREISNFRGDMLKRRDLIIEEVIERKLSNKNYHN